MYRSDMAYNAPLEGEESESESEEKAAASEVTQVVVNEEYYRVV